MTNYVTVVRKNSELKETLDLIKSLKERWKKIGLGSRTTVFNQEILFVRQLYNMFELAEVITLGALQRDESRGAHYKPYYPQRNDRDWLKTTMANWSPDGPLIDYAPVDVSLIPPRARRYDI